MLFITRYNVRWGWHCFFLVADIIVIFFERCESLIIFLVLPVDTTIKLIGAGAFAFHPTLEWIFVGDRRGTLLAWDVSTERPNMIGM